MNEEIIVVDLHTTGTDPFKDFITAISCKWLEGEKIFTGTEEDNVLRDFGNFLEKEQFKRLVGFNINNFDIPFLKLRCLKHNVSLGHLAIEYMDLRVVLANNRDRVKGRLCDYKKLLDITEEYPKMGVNIYWSPEVLSKYEDVLLDDVRTTWALYERSLDIGLI
jgi:predicted PolB exonuclease-like 3'-5' exonuclease